MAANEKQFENYTQAGFDALREELNDLKQRREENKADIAHARSYGDLSENSEYDEAKNEQAKIATRIAELEKKIAIAHIIDESEIDETVVSIGSVVEVKNVKAKTKKTYHIVGSYESNPLEGKISDQSPIGNALLGTRCGAKVKVELPNGKEMEFQILHVSRAGAVS